MWADVPGFVCDTMNSQSAITASVGFRSRHASVRISTTPGGRDLSRDDPGSPSHRMRRLRSEDSATGKAEGGDIELCRSHALRMMQPHADAPAHGKRDATQAIDDLR